MIEMPMSNQNRVRLRREISHSLCDSRHVRSNARAERNTQKINTRKVGIDQQSAPVELELVTICTQGTSRALRSVALRQRPLQSDQYKNAAPRLRLARRIQRKEEARLSILGADSTEAFYRGQLQVCLTNSALLPSMIEMSVEYTDAPTVRSEPSTGDKMACPYCGHLLPKDATKCDRCDWTRGAMKRRKAKRVTPSPLSLVSSPAWDIFIRATSLRAFSGCLVRSQSGFSCCWRHSLLRAGASACFSSISSR